MDSPRTETRNVFVLNTGRCGSLTFVRACQHVTNYTAAHESLSGMIGDERFAYPPNHIEADNRLSWLLGRLDRHYGKDAVYVHLSRDAIDVARSFTRRYDRGMMRAYHAGILLDGPNRNHDDHTEVALDYCDTVDSNIALFLRDKPYKIEVRLENAEADFTAFWSYIGAEGDLASALGEFRVRHNASVGADASGLVRGLLEARRRVGGALRVLRG